jgi:hypothetical protein
VAEQSVSDRIDEDFRLTFGSEEGERVLRWLMDKYWIWEGLLEPDPHKTAFNEGQRAVIVDILDRIRRKWSPTEFAEQITQARLDYSTSRPSQDPSANHS